MFSTENVPAYLKSIVLKTEAKKRMASLRFFITPITYNLALEAAPAIADRLFNANSDHTPVQEMGRTEFLVRIPKQSMSYKRHPDYVGHDVLIPEVAIDGISAQKVIQGNPNFSLIFDASFEIGDKTVIPDMIDLLKEKVYVTFKPLQGSLFEEPAKYADALCRLCDAPNPEFKVKGSSKIFYCQKDVDQREEGEEVERIRNTDQAAKVVDEMRGETDGSGESSKKAVDPLLAGEDINKRASQRQRGKRVR
jgi:hypothetical protein